MRRILYIIIYIPLLLLTACDVHEWPDLPNNVQVHLKLNYETMMTEWHHKYENNKATEVSLGETYDNHQSEGYIRYIIRAYPITRRHRAMTRNFFTHEFVYVREVSQGYNCEFLLDLLPGEYYIKVWSDLLESEDQLPFYDVDDFANILLQGEHKGSSDIRDAFRGITEASLVADYTERAPQEINITMQRPLAKFELIATDLKDFLEKEIEYLTKTASTRGEEAPTRVNTENYTVKFYQPDMVYGYNMDGDVPNDTYPGTVVFESKLNILSEDEASLGFDYIFVNGTARNAYVNIVLCDNEGREIAKSEQVAVPVKRSRHTKLKGSFLTLKSSGGIKIESDFNGNHNYIYGDDEVEYDKTENEKE